jgi:AraC-like DNA-binding protein
LADQPDLSIDEVSSTCGFGSKVYFSTRFRQLYGMTPSDFRARAINGNPIEETDDLAD